jgi:hypothetical protein
VTIEDVWFTAPVCVTVNTETATVERVVVVDESVVLMPAGNPTESVSTEAIEVATSDAEWPAWEFGF